MRKLKPFVMIGITTLWVRLKLIAIIASWVVPLLLCAGLSTAFLLSPLEPTFDRVLNGSMSWSITFGYGMLMLIPSVIALFRRKFMLALGVAICLCGYFYSVGISIEDPYYWGHVPKLYLILWAITLALARYELAVFNFVIACLSWVMVDQFGAIIPAGVGEGFKIALNILYVLCAATAAIAAMIPTDLSHDTEEKQENPRERLPVSQAPIQKAA